MGAPLNGDPIKAHRYYQQQAWFQRMMDEQQRQAYADRPRYGEDMNPYLSPRPRDVYIAGQVFDGATGERK